MKSPAIKPAIKPHIIRLLKEHGPMSTTLLANRLACTPNACGLVMRKSPKEFYVHSWTKNGQQIWAYGQGENAPRPVPAGTKYDRQQEYRRKKEAEMREHQRLKQGYITGERIQWGGLCL